MAIVFNDTVGIHDNPGCASYFYNSSVVERGDCHGSSVYSHDIQFQVGYTAIDIKPEDDFYLSANFDVSYGMCGLGFGINSGTYSYFGVLTYPNTYTEPQRSTLTVEVSDDNGSTYFNIPYETNVTTKISRTNGTVSVLINGVVITSSLCDYPADYVDAFIDNQVLPTENHELNYVKLEIIEPVQAGQFFHQFHNSHEVLSG